MRRRALSITSWVVATLAVSVLAAPAARAADFPSYNPGFHATDLTQSTFNNSNGVVTSAKQVTATSYYNTTLYGYAKYGPRAYPTRNDIELQSFPTRTGTITLPAVNNQVLGLLCDQYADGIWWVKADYRIGSSGLFIGYFPVFTLHQRSVAVLDQSLGSCF